jgi:hypothetical protein
VIIERVSTSAATATVDGSPVEHPSRAERAARGKAARAEAPRSSHAAWEPAPGRRDPVERLAASFAVAGRDRGFDAKQRRAINVAVGRSYRHAMRDFARMPTLDVWYARVDIDEVAKQWAAEATAKQLKRLNRNLGIVLMLGADSGDPLFLQFKEAEASVLEPYLGKSRFGNNGQRVVEGQRLMQAASDIMLGWFRTAGVDGVERDFYIRQLWDSKGSALVEAMEPQAMAKYAELCGWTLARSHARSGDAVAIAAYLGSGDAFDRALAVFAESYADQNERDYAALRDACDTGRVAAETGL